MIFENVVEGQICPVRVKILDNDWNILCKENVGRNTEKEQWEWRTILQAEEQK